MNGKKAFSLYSQLPTEKINPNTKDLDRLPLRKILQKINDEDKKVPLAVRKAIPQIEKASILLSQVFLKKGKIFFIGAGTSGRLGVLEASELPPTFGVSPLQFVAIMAGGRKAVFRAQEGAEDIYRDGAKAVRNIKKGDLLIGIAASGITPYVRGAMDFAAQKGAKVIFITCNSSERSKIADVVIALDVGPEAINGSTRMKSGTATKLALNMLTSAAMIISGKVYKNWMVDLKITSFKLLMRAQRILSQIARISPLKAKKYLKKANYNLKEAIVMARLNIDLKNAKKLLKQKKGFLKDIIGED